MLSITTRNHANHGLHFPLPRGSSNPNGADFGLCQATRRLLHGDGGHPFTQFIVEKNTTWISTKSEPSTLGKGDHFSTREHVIYIHLEVLENDSFLVLENDQRPHLGMFYKLCIEISLTPTPDRQHLRPSGAVVHSLQIAVCLESMDMQLPPIFRRFQLHPAVSIYRFVSLVSFPVMV